MGREGTFVYEDSVSTVGHGIGCIVTGLYYGGWCWVYTLMPFSSDIEDMKYEGSRELRKSLKGKKVQITSQSVYKVGWNSSRSYSKLEWYDPPSSSRDQDTERDYEDNDNIADKNENSKEFSSLEESPKKSSRFYLSGQLGTLYSPHGSGFSLGVLSGNWRMEFGYGYSVRDTMGVPWSLSLYYDIGRIYFGTGISHYNGSGIRDIEYRYGRVVKNVQTEWDIWYAQGLVGFYISKNDNSRFRVFADAGYGGAVRAKFKVNDKNENINRETDGKPKAICTDDLFQRPSKSPTDMGPFARVGVSYILF